MQTKTYFASSVPAALEVARKELGEEALLVNSRPAPADARAFGRLEVTFAFDRLARLSEEVPVEAPAQAPVRMRGAVANRAATSELDEIRQQISALRAAVGGAALGGAAVGGSGGNAVEAAPASEWEAAFAEARRPGERGLLVQELIHRIPQADFAEMKPDESRTLAFIGPAGRGKSSSLVKVAVRYGLARRIPVRIYSAGAHGVGGQEQMARFASLLGVPFQACESLESLHLILNGHSWKGLSLIDTPGIGLSDRAEMAEWARFFLGRPEIERHLVLRADAQSADMFHVVNRFSSLGASRLLFTGVDEALNPGAMVDTLIRTRIPSVFAGTGPRIPEDLEEVSAVQLARSLRSGGEVAAVAA